MDLENGSNKVHNLNAWFFAQSIAYWRWHKLKKSRIESHAHNMAWRADFIFLSYFSSSYTKLYTIKTIKFKDNRYAVVLYNGRWETKKFLTILTFVRLCFLPNRMQ